MASVWGRVVQAGKAGRDVFRRREQWKLDMKEQDMARELEVLGIAAINGKGEHMRQERRAFGSQSMSKGAFWPCQGPLKSLEVADPRIADLRTPAHLLLQAVMINLPTSWLASRFLPVHWSHFLGLTSQAPGSHSRCVRTGQKTPARLTDPASPMSVVSCSPQSPSVGVGPSPSCCWTLVSQMA